MLLLHYIKDYYTTILVRISQFFRRAHQNHQQKLLDKAYQTLQYQIEVDKQFITIIDTVGHLNGMDKDTLARYELTYSILDYSTLGLPNPLNTKHS